MSENYNFQPQQNPQDGYPQQGYQQPYPPTIDPEAIKAEKNAKIYSITSLVLGAVGIGIFAIGFGIVAVVSCIRGLIANKGKNAGYTAMALIGGLLGVFDIVLWFLSRLVSYPADSTQKTPRYT